MNFEWTGQLHFSFSHSRFARSLPLLYKVFVENYFHEKRSWFFLASLVFHNTHSSSHFINKSSYNYLLFCEKLLFCSLSIACLRREMFTMIVRGVISDNFKLSTSCIVEFFSPPHTRPHPMIYNRENFHSWLRTRVRDDLLIWNSLLLSLWKAKRVNLLLATTGRDKLRWQDFKLRVLV
jgi:hypothetical protein